MKKILLIAIVLLYTNSVYSQVKIDGLVQDGLTNETLIGANVIVKSSKIGTSTDFNGEYSIDHNGSFPVTFIVSYIGYTDLEIEVTSKNPKPIRLFPDSKSLQEVKVIDSRIT